MKRMAKVKGSLKPWDCPPGQQGGIQGRFGLNRRAPKEFGSTSLHWGIAEHD